MMLCLALIPWPVRLLVLIAIAIFPPQDTDASKEAGVADSAVAALGAVAAVLPWAQYEQLLSRFLRLMKASGTKFLVRGRAGGGRGAYADTWSHCQSSDCMSQRSLPGGFWWGGELGSMCKKLQETFLSRPSF